MRAYSRILSAVLVGWLLSATIANAEQTTALAIEDTCFSDRGGGFPGAAATFRGLRYELQAATDACGQGMFAVVTPFADSGRATSQSWPPSNRRNRSSQLLVTMSNMNRRGERPVPTRS